MAATAGQRRRGVVPRRNGSSIVRGNSRAGTIGTIGTIVPIVPIGIGRHRSFSFTCRSSMDNDEDMDDSDGEYDGPHSSEDEEFTYVLGGDVDGLFDGGDPSMRLYLDSADYEQWKRYVVLTSTGVALSSLLADSLTLSPSPGGLRRVCFTGLRRIRRS
jgi:hypothetical protein